MMKSRLRLVACVALMFPAACDGGMSPTSDAEPDAAPVRVGFLVSGDRTYANGAMIAVDEVNGRGGLLGRTVELVVRMGLEEAAAAVEAAETMIGSDEVVALIGPNRSSHAIEVGAVAQRHGVPMITTAATNPGVTAAGDLVFMAAFTDQFQGRVMAEFAAGTLGVTAAAVLTERGNVYSEGIGEFFIDRFRGSGGAIVADESYERGATEFAAQLAPIAAATLRTRCSCRSERRTWCSSPRRQGPCRCTTLLERRSCFSGPTPGTTPRCWTAAQPPWMAASSAPTSRRTRTSQRRARSSTRTGPGTASRPRAATR